MLPQQQQRCVYIQRNNDKGNVDTVEYSFAIQGVIAMSVAKISIASDFSPYPAGRYRTDGPYPGETFRDEKLIPALRENDEVIVYLDGTNGYGSSFLEEAFGGLVRRGFTALELEKKLKIESSRSSYKQRVWTYIKTSGN